MAAASQAIFTEAVSCVILSSSSHVLFKVFENELQGVNNSNEERSHSNGTHMEEQASAQTLGDGALGVLSISLAEIPDTASGDNDELGKSNEEGVVSAQTLGDG